MTDTADEKQRLKARELNELIRYTMWAVFAVTDRDALDANRGDAATELTDLLDQANGKGIVTRGCYDLQGMRADADYMLWWVAPTSDELQEMYVNFRRTTLGRGAGAGVERDGAAPPGRVKQEPHPRLPGRGGAEELRLRLPLRQGLRVVPDRGVGATPDAVRARHEGQGVPGRAAQHGVELRAGRLRVDARVRGR